jgi:hypothetical protein
VFDVIGQCFSIAQAKMSMIWKRDADLVLEPNVDGFTYDGFERAKDLIVAGENSVRPMLPSIKAWMQVADVPLGSAPRAQTVAPVVAPIAPAPSGFSA